MPQEPHFSVILPVCHGGRFLRRVLLSACALEVPSEAVEVIVVVDEADADSRAIVSEAAGQAPFPMDCLTVQASTRARMLNVACSKARGRVWVFADDDCVFPADWLPKVQAAWESHGEATVLGGRDELAPGGSAFDVALDWALNSFIVSGGCRRPGGLRIGRYYPRLWNMSLPRSAAQGVSRGVVDGRLQLFDESADVHEDVELCARVESAGGKIVYAPEVLVQHHRDTTFGKFVGRNFGMARACRRLGVHRAAHSALAAGLLVTIGLAACAVFSEAGRMALGAWVAAYAALLACHAAWAVVKTRRLAMLVLVPVLIVGAHASRGLGFLAPGPRQG